MARFGPHPDAALRMNEHAAKLLANFAQISPASLKREQRTDFTPDTVVAATITEKDIIGPVRHLGTINPYDRTTLEILVDNGEVAYKLDKENAAEFEKLITRISRLKPYSLYVSRDTIRTAAIEWFEERLTKAHESAFLDSLHQALNKRITKKRAVVPIAFLHVQSPIEFGGLRIEPLSSEFFDKYLQSRLDARGEVTEEQRVGLNDFLDEIRKRHQGYAAAVMDIEAEPDFVAQRAIETADRVIGVFRLLGPGAFLPLYRSFVAPANLEPAPDFNIWISDSDEALEYFFQRGYAEPPVPWSISDQQFAQLRSNGVPLEALSLMAAGKDLSEFQDKLAESLLFFSKAITCATPAEKLVFVMISLEALLLRDATEPVQQTVGDRLALLATRDPGKRRQYVAVMKEAYNLRSRFLHHGLAPDNLELLENIFTVAWGLLLQLATNHKLFKTKAALLEFADSRKYA